MENIYAALLLHKLGKPIEVNAIKRIIEAAGGVADESSIKSLVVSLEGVNIEKALEEAKAMPTVSVSPATGIVEKKEEKKEEPKAEIAAEGLAALFG
ncbi:MAG: 50S ribosomal protein L12 [Candidatus Pacearchaeota archaeon]